MEKLHAPAKINAFLKIKAKDAQGYHLLESCMLKLALGDEIELNLRNSATFKLEVGVENYPKLSNEKNIVYQAVKLFCELSKKKLSGSILIKKRIFVQAGLGGGSSNAGVVLRYLNKSFGSILTVQKLLNIAAQLGSDVPFFVLPETGAFVEGRGTDIRARFKTPLAYILLVKPDFGHDTADIYRRLNFIFSKDTKLSPCEYELPKNADDLIQLLDLGNDLEEPAFTLHPELPNIQEDLLAAGAVRARMSGSGSTIFGLFREKKAAEKARKAVEKWGQTKLPGRRFNNALCSGR